MLCGKATCDRTSARNADLLAEYCAQCKLTAVDMAWCPETGHRGDRRPENGIGSEHLHDRDRIGIEIQQPAQPANGRGQVTDVV
jgi:hypothetical protein